MEELELEALNNYVEENKDLAVRLKDVIAFWKICYGEDIVLEYPGFIQKLIENESN